MKALDAVRDSKPEYVVSVCLVLQEDATEIVPYINTISQVLMEQYRYFEILLVDNYTGDEMQARLGELLAVVPDLRIVRLSRSAHREVALAAGLERCIGDYVLILELGADPITLIPGIMDMLRSRDIVIGRCENRRFPGLQGIVRRFGSRIAGRLLHCNMDPCTGSCYGLSRRAVNSLTQGVRKYRHIVYDTQVIGFSRAQVNYVVPSRFANVNGSPLRTALDYFNIITAHSMAPLRMAAGLAIFASVLNIMYLGYIVVVAMIKNKVAEGWITTSLTHTTMFLLLFFVVALLAEYMERLLNETRQEPLYYVEFETHSTQPSRDHERLNIL